MISLLILNAPAVSPVSLDAFVAKCHEVVITKSLLILLKHLTSSLLTARRLHQFVFRNCSFAMVP